MNIVRVYKILVTFKNYLVWIILYIGDRNMDRLEISNLSKSYDKKVLNDINLILEPGLYGLLGANGAGKSTLMKILATLLKPSSGNVVFNGEKVNRNNSKYLDKISYLPQDFGVYSNFSGKEFIDYIGKLKGVPTGKLRELSEILFKKFELCDYKSRNVAKYSGGMKRRIGIIQAFINNPSIILLDEPTAGLDPMQRLTFKNFISEESKNRIIIYSTHITEDIESICDNIIMIKSGEIISEGTEEEVLKALENKIYEIIISKSDLLDFLENNLVVNYKEQDNSYRVRYISNKQTCNSKLVKPNLEDLYLYYNKRVGDVKNV